MCFNLINPVTPHKDCPNQDLTKLKYKAFSPILWSGQVHLDSRTDFKVLDCVQKSFDPELEIQIVRHQSIVSCLQVTIVISGLKNIYTHIFYKQLLAAEHSAGESLVQWQCTLTSQLYAIPVSPYFLVKRTTNPYGTKRPSLDKHHHPVITYHLVTNLFKNYMINHLFIIH